MSGRGEQGRRVLDEALRLLDTLQSTGTGPADPVRSADPAASAPHAGTECRICPLCRAMAHQREANPDATERLAAAVVDLGAALRDLLGTAPGPGAAPGPRAAPRTGPAGDPDDGPAVPRVDVQRIDVTE